MNSGRDRFVELFWLQKAHVCACITPCIKSRLQATPIHGILTVKQSKHTVSLVILRGSWILIQQKKKAVTIINKTCV